MHGPFVHQPFPCQSHDCHTITLCHMEDSLWLWIVKAAGWPCTGKGSSKWLHLYLVKLLYKKKHFPYVKFKKAFLIESPVGKLVPFPVGSKFAYYSLSTSAMTYSDIKHSTLTPVKQECVKNSESRTPFITEAWLKKTHFADFPKKFFKSQENCLSSSLVHS